MVDFESIERYLREHLADKKYRHSILVSEEAVKLAEFYGGDAFKARLAGLVHDCARGHKKELQLHYIEMAGIALDSTTLEVKELLHGPAAVYICKEEFNIYDKEVLSAVRYHTTGKVNMTLLEKIIFLADYIEPTRSFPGVEAIRRLAYGKLDRALLKAMESTISYVMFKNELIHPDTVLSRNDILRSLRPSIQSGGENVRLSEK